VLLFTTLFPWGGIKWDVIRNQASRPDHTSESSEQVDPQFQNGWTGKCPLPSVLKVVPIYPPAKAAYLTDHKLPFKQHVTNRGSCQQSMCFEVMIWLLNLSLSPLPTFRRMIPCFPLASVLLVPLQCSRSSTIVPLSFSPSTLQ
jgi:hypothetical protein